MFKKFVHINCKKATELIVQKNEIKLSFVNLLRLKYHQKICAICYYFEQHISFISKNAQKIDELNQAKLTEQEKHAMQEKLLQQQRLN